MLVDEGGYRFQHVISYRAIAVWVKPGSKSGYGKFLRIFARGDFPLADTICHWHIIPEIADYGDFGARFKPLYNEKSEDTKLGILTFLVGERRLELPASWSRRLETNNLL